MIKNYIFDFGNVIARFIPDEMTGLFVKDENALKIISSAVFDRLYWDRLDAGTISDDEVKDALLKRLPENMGKDACIVYDNWINSMTPVPGMKELIEDIKNSGNKLYLLSNISTGFADGYTSVGWINEILSSFDGVVFSGKIGLTKPNKNIFEYILNKYELLNDECIFIDDSAINIEGAKEVGIKGYLFDGDSKKLREFLGIKNKV